MASPAWPQLSAAWAVLPWCTQALLLPEGEDGVLSIPASGSVGAELCSFPG